MRRQATAVSSTPGLAKPCLMFFPSLCTRFIGIRYATYPEGKRCANLDAVLGRGACQLGGPAVPVFEDMTRRMLKEDMEYRLDENPPARPASPEEAAIWRTQAAKKTPGPSSVVWFFPVPK